MVIFGRIVGVETKELHKIYVVTDSTGCINVIDYKSASAESEPQTEYNFGYVYAGCENSWVKALRVPADLRQCC